jgi:hypothetical protein
VTLGAPEVGCTRHAIGIAPKFRSEPGSLVQRAVIADHRVRIHDLNGRAVLNRVAVELPRERRRSGNGPSSEFRSAGVAERLTKLAVRVRQRQRQT